MHLPAKLQKLLTGPHGPGVGEHCHARESSDDSEALRRSNAPAVGSTPRQ